MTHKLNYLISALLILVVSGSIFAQGERMGRRQMDDDNPPMGPMKKMAKMLDLTESQQSQIQDLHLKHMREMLPLKSEMESLKTELKLAETEENFNAAKVESIVKKIEALRTKMTMSKIMHHQEIRKLLTPEQRKKFDAMRLMGKKGKDGSPHGKRGHRGPDRD